MRYLYIIFLLLNSCISLPDVYVVDQATVLQEEAGGHWPDMEKAFRKSSIKKTPTAFREDVDKNKRTVYKVLNGPMLKAGKVK